MTTTTPALAMPSADGRFETTTVERRDLRARRFGFGSFVAGRNGGGRNECESEEERLADGIAKGH